jgi:hypothetical protein
MKKLKIDLRDLPESLSTEHVEQAVSGVDFPPFETCVGELVVRLKSKQRLSSTFACEFFKRLCETFSFSKITVEDQSENSTHSRLLQAGYAHVCVLKSAGQ